jgi:transcription elongation factor GreA
MLDLEAKKQQLKNELEKLRYEFKVDLPKRINEAREYGDLKENAEYHAARERQSMVEALIAQLTQQLNQMSALKLEDISVDRIGYGSKITVLDKDTDSRIEFSLVSPGDVNPSEGKITISSPIGAALNGKMAGDDVEFVIPAGKKKYYIEKFITAHGGTFEKKI